MFVPDRFCAFAARKNRRGGFVYEQHFELRLWAARHRLCFGEGDDHGCLYFHVLGVIDIDASFAGQRVGIAERR